MKTTLRLIGLSFCFSFFLLSCSKNNKTVPVQLLLTDNPAAYDSVNVHIKGIKVKIDKDTTSWITINAKDTVVNLLDLQNGTTMLMAQDNIPEGILKEVRFILGSDNYVVESGMRHPLEAPSAEDSGLKIKIDKHLQETLNTFTLDFDASLSIKEESGGYKLMPVIKLK
jgi:hypothetical protein